MPEREPPEKAADVSMTIQQDLESKILETWPYSRWQNTKTIVALSGGLDSVALLRLLLAIDNRMRATESEPPSSVRSDSPLHPTIIAAHFDHRTRDGESAIDASSVRGLCQALNVKCIVGRADIENSTASEDSMRQQRYQFLEKTAKQAGARYMATAHHQDDQIETVLFRIFRGTGLTGLAGIKPTRVIDYGLTLVRPLLNIPRERLEQLLKNWGQDYLGDPTNEDPQYDRNRLRNDWLPKLNQEFSGRTSPSLLRLAEQATELDNFLTTECEPLIDHIVSNPTVDTNQTMLQFERALLANQHPLIIKTCLRSVWRKLGYPEQAMGQTWWERMAVAIQSSQPITLNLPGDLRFELSAGKCRISRSADRKDHNSPNTRR